jgi:outer membrane immunogenic protein
MFKVVLSTLVVGGLLALTVGAQAADMGLPVKAPAARAAPAVPPPFSWTGLYLGGQVGYGFGESSGTQNAGGTFFPVVPYDLDPRGALAGVHAGFNYQIGAVVLGAEANLEAANLHGDTSFPAFDQTYFFHVKADTLASVRGRLGWAWDRVMLYGTGGAAFGNVSTPPLDRLDGWRTGWTAGAGAEYAFRGPWSARLEYRYTDLGRVSSFDPNLASTDDNKLAFHAIRLGVSYKLGGGPAW